MVSKMTHQTLIRLYVEAYSTASKLVCADNFFARAAEAYKTKLPTRLALCFDEQLLDDAEIPMEPHDVFMEEIITPTRHIIAGAVPTIKYTNVEAS